MAEPKVNRNQRRIYFIEKSFQSRFILKYCIIVLLGGLSTIAIIYFLAMQSTTVFFTSSHIVAKSTADFILPILIKTVLIVTAFVAVATIAVTLFVSHKIAGPLYRFKEVMDAVGEGNFLSDFKIRHLDQMQDLATAFDSMIKKMRAEINAIKKSSTLVQKKVDYLSAGEGLSEEKKAELTELKNAAEELNKTIAQLKS